MGIYLNPLPVRMEKLIKSKIFVDKSDILEILNEHIETENCFFCISRPRRFGKSVTARMICSYYAKDQHNASLFDHLKIASAPSYKTHLNQYNVILINMSGEFNRASQNVLTMIASLTRCITTELKSLYPSCNSLEHDSLDFVLQNAYNYSSVPFVVVIDEWDCIMREKKEDPQTLKLYLEWLKGLFKDQDYIALAYLTGILPIKKYGTQSALNMFKEYSMINPGKFAPYIGFTEQEVMQLCVTHHVDFKNIAHWYDGYSFEKVSHIYNPNSVVRSIDDGDFKSYWTNTETFESLQKYIDLNLFELRDDVVRLIAGENIVVNTYDFQNDMITIKNKDNALTLLIHLGYLALKFDSKIKLDNISKVLAHIPNEEIKSEFRNAIENNANYQGVYPLIAKSRELLNSIWSLDSKAVAKSFDEAHQDHTSILKYNDENSLACVVALSLLLGTTDTYNVIREFPTGKGFADLVYLPKQGIDKPALVVELKFDQSAEAAISQIKRKNYLNAFKDYQGNVLLVGINYSKETKVHQCKIEKAVV